MKINEKLLKTFLENVETKHDSIRHFKMAAINCNQYEFAAQLREIEKTLFPETEEQKSAKKQGNDVALALAMVGLQRPTEKIAWLINETIKSQLKLKGKFSLKDAEKIKAKAEELFSKQELN